MSPTQARSGKTRRSSSTKASLRLEIRAISKPSAPRSSRRSRKATTLNEARPDGPEERQERRQRGLRDPCRGGGFGGRGVRRADEIRERRQAYSSLAHRHRRVRKSNDRMVRFRKEDLQKDRSRRAVRGIKRHRRCCDRRRRRG